MDRKVVSLHPSPRTIGHFFYVGSCHRQLHNLLSNGTLSMEGAVIDAAHARQQRELIAELKKGGRQIILDTRSMELALPSGCTAPRRALSWACSDGPWRAESWGNPKILGDLCKRIAEFAVEVGADTVLSPSHLHHKSISEWFLADTKACELLRLALDAADGSSIGIDYLLAASFPVLQAEHEMRVFQENLSGLPFDNLWLRADGFGGGAGAARTRNLLYCASALTRAGKPIVLDSAGGFPALMAAAFGVVGGIAHGIANQGEQFNSYNLRRQPKLEPGKGGSATWVYLASIDKYIKASQLESLFEIRGVRPHLMCTDESCCPLGERSMRSNPKRHAMKQRVRQLYTLSAVPENRRPEHLLSQELRPAGQLCRKIERIPALENTSYFKPLRDHSRQLDDLAQLIERLTQVRSELTRSEEPVRRTSLVIPKSRSM